MIGVVNTLYEHMSLEYEEDSLKWAKDCGVARENVYGGKQAFVGNPCHRLLERVDLLQQLSEQRLIYGLSKYVKCFRAFKSVVSSCFSLKIDPDYITHCEEFKKSYLEIGIPITPKVHAVFFHVPYFCQKNGKGLGFFSEQAIETVHSDFWKTCKNFKVKSSHPDYPNRLLKPVQKYNAEHI